MRYKKLFHMPKPVNITGRASTITNSFVNAIIPVVAPSEKDVKEALEKLNLSAEPLRCSYCGNHATEWDHLRPLVEGGKPTGYISEIQNLVPSCNTCNQSKRNKPWDQWMTSAAPKSPKSRGVKDIDAKMKRLHVFERWRTPTKIDFSAIVENKDWEQHWKNRENMDVLMRSAQCLASEIRRQVEKTYRDRIAKKSDD